MGFGESCLRVTCYVLQFICFITGAVMLGLGIWGIVDENLSRLIVGDDTMAGGLYLLVIAGGLILLTSLFGCFSIKKERKLYVIIYCIVALIAIFLKVVGCILIFDYFVSRHQELSGSYKETYGIEDDITVIWDHMQRTGECCGLINYQDWEESHFFINKGNAYPESCCIPKPQPLPQDKEYCIGGREGYIYSDGCDGVIKKYYYGIGGAAIGIIIIEFFAVVMLACLYQYYP